MNVFEFLAFAIAVLSIGGVIVVDRLFAGKRGVQQQLQLAEQRLQELMLRLSEAERHNDDLRQQLEWNRRLLEAQDRVLEQLGAPRREAEAELPAARPRG